jgi:hypothetical protein
MSIEQKVRVANAVQIFCGAALVGLLIAQLIGQLDPLVLILAGLGRVVS